MTPSLEPLDLTYIDPMPEPKPLAAVLASVVAVLLRRMGGEAIVSRVDLAGVPHDAVAVQELGDGRLMFKVATEATP